MITTSLAEIRSHGPCNYGFDKLRKYLGVTPSEAKTHSEPFPVTLVLESNDLRDALWVTAHVAPQALIHFLIRRLDDGEYSALKTLRSLDGKYSRQIDAVETVTALLRRHMAGQSVSDDLVHACRAAADVAGATARAAYAAADAAEAAACVADAAAYAAACAAHAAAATVTDAAAPDAAAAANSTDIRTVLRGYSMTRESDR